MTELVLWAADHVHVWRPFAIAMLSGLALACAWYAFSAWERLR